MKNTPVPETIPNGISIRSHAISLNSAWFTLNLIPILIYCNASWRMFNRESAFLRKNSPWRRDRLALTGPTEGWKTSSPRPLLHKCVEEREKKRDVLPQGLFSPSTSKTKSITNKRTMVTSSVSIQRLVRSWLRS